MKSKIIPAMVCLLVVFLITLIPGENVPQTPNIIGFDKIVHFGMFFALTFLWGRVWLHAGVVKGSTNNLKIITNFLVFGIFIAILVEYLQRYVPGRAFDYMDIVANISGGTIGTISIFILRKCRSRLVQ